MTSLPHMHRSWVSYGIAKFCAAYCTGVDRQVDNCNAEETNPAYSPILIFYIKFHFKYAKLNKA